MWDELDPAHRMELASLQSIREEDMLDCGARRYWDSWQRAGGVGRAEERTVGDLLRFHVARLYDLQVEMTEVTPGVRVDPLIRAIVATAPVEELAGISLLVPLQAAMETGGRGIQLQQAIANIGAAVRRTLVVHEARAEWIARTEKMATICQSWDYDAARMYLKRLNMNPEVWPAEAKLRVGAWLLREALLSNALYANQLSNMTDLDGEFIDLASSRNNNGLRQIYQREHVNKNGIITFQTQRAAGKTMAYLRLTDAAFERLIDGHLGAEHMRPARGPMIIPPTPWTNDHDGGYVLIRNDLVKPVRGHKIQPQLSQAVLDAVNVLQQTEWTIDERVVKVIEQVWAAGGDRCGLPPRERPEMPPRLINATPEEIKANKLARRLAWDEWYNEQSNRLAVARTLAEGKQLEGLSVWFTWTMDFRGRMYPMADCLSPQGCDYQKAPLVFAEAKPLTKQAHFNWLAINLANLYGVDKVSLEDRCKWVELNDDLIRRTVADPMNMLEWWEQADKPFCFLAACYDYIEAHHTYRSRIPVGLDGSCNGIQHLSAMGRDLRGATATNLVPSDEPRDIYDEVADVLYPLIASDDSEFRQLFPKDRVTRELAKRATMTTPYGVTRQGIRTQFITDGHLAHLDKQMQGEISSWLTGLTMQAIGTVVQSAREVMDWFQLLAKAANDRQQALVWEVPDGMVITQEYLKHRTYTVRLPGMGQTQFRISDETLGINKLNQRNGSAPNIVHSFDACHARLVARDLSLFTTDLAWVHDSLGCHACHCDQLSWLIRDNFVWLHEQPILENLHASIAQQLDCTLPAPPIVGDLDVSVVRWSDYFFA